MQNNAQPCISLQVLSQNLQNQQSKQSVYEFFNRLAEKTAQENTKREAVTTNLTSFQAIMAHKITTFLKIIYASAKNVISRYRKTMILKKPIMKKNAKRCHYKKLTYQNPQIQIICLNGGFQRK